MGPRVMQWQTKFLKEGGGEILPETLMVRQRVLVTGETYETGRIVAHEIKVLLDQR